MTASNPNCPNRQPHAHTMGEQTQNRSGFSLLPGQTHGKSNPGHPVKSHLPDQPQRPDAKQDIQIAQKGEPQHRGQKPIRERLQITRQCSTPGTSGTIIRVKNCQPGKTRRPVFDQIPQQRESSHGKSHPEQPVPHKWGPSALAVESFRQIEGNLRQRIRQPFVPNPLLLEHRRQTQPNSRHRQSGGHRPKNRSYPRSPRHYCTFLQPQKKTLCHPGKIRGKHPPGQIVKNQLLPPVLGRRIISRCRHRAHPLRNPVISRKRPTHPEHAQRQPQLCGSHRQAGQKPLQKSIHQKPCHKGQQHRQRQIRHRHMCRTRFEFQKRCGNTGKN